MCVLIRCLGLWRKSNNQRKSWWHVQHNQSHCHWPHADTNDFRWHSLVMTQQANAITCPLLAETCCRHSFTSKQAANHSARSPLSLEMKQQHVESDYTRGTLLCPPQSDDGDGRAWIFTCPDVNILACQRSTSPVPAPLHLHGSVKSWSCLYLATLTYLLPLFPIPPFHIWITEWTNCRLLENQWKWLIVVLISVSS